MTGVRNHWQLILITMAVFALWKTPAIVPLKILIVFFHEISHGLMAVFTGGSIENITFSPQQGGAAWTRGGNGFLVLSAGYLGSLLIGVLLFFIALKTRLDRGLMAVLGFGLLLITALYIRDGFAIAFGAGAGVLMLITARRLSETINDLILRVIGLTSMIYVPYDIFDDTILRSGERSDAFMLAEQVGGTTMIWGGIWLAISVAVIIGCLRLGLTQASNISFENLT